MKTSDYIIIGVAVLLVLIIIFVTWLYFYRKKRQVKPFEDYHNYLNRENPNNYVNMSPIDKLNFRRGPTVQEGSKHWYNSQKRIGNVNATIHKLYGNKQKFYQ